MNAFLNYARDLARVAGDLDSLASLRVQRVAKGATATARSVAPTETGKLRSGLRTVRLSDGSYAVESIVSGDYYPHFQEYGTSRMAPNPFMGPAVDRWAPELYREIEGLVDDISKELT